MFISKTTLFSRLAACVLGFAFIGVPAGSTAAQTAEISAEETVGPKADVFITDLVDKLRVLASEDQADSERKSALRVVLAEDMATGRLKGFLLSREQRKALSEEQVAEYDEVFPLYISSAFAGSIDQLVTRTIKVNDVLERRPGDYVVRSKLFADNGEERAGLDWRVLEKDGRKQLVDVMVDGLSFNVERRAQFTAILNKDGFDALIEHMREVAEE